MRRGFSLVEMVVVVFIGIVIILSLTPVAIGLIRQQKALSAPVLGVEALPLLWERLRADFAIAESVAADPPYESPSFRLTLLPQKREDPEVVWRFRGSQVTREARRKEEDGEVEVTTRSWTLPGPLSLDREQRTSSRTVLRYAPPKGEEEFFAFLTGRPTVKR